MSPETRCPCCGGDGWLLEGWSTQQVTCQRCHGRGKVARDEEWRQRLIGLLLGLGLAIALIGAMLVWGAR